MLQHVPGGPLLCIHSVVTARWLRRRGVGSWLLRRYVCELALRATEGLRDAGEPGGGTPWPVRAALIAKARNVPLYARVGSRRPRPERGDARRGPVQSDGAGPANEMTIRSVL